MTLRRLFYRYGGLVASTDPVFLQGVFDTRTGLFDRVGIWKNSGKIFRMIYCPCCAAGNQSEEVHKRQMTGELITKQDR